MGVADDLPLIDQHCHAVRLDPLDLATFTALCTEASEPAVHGTHLDGPVGLALRRWCPPILDLDPFCSWEDYIARRLELGGEEVARRFIRSTNTSSLMIDTGYRGDELCGLDKIRDLAAAPVGEIVRVEVLAEQIAAEGVRAIDFLDVFEARLEARCSEPGVVGLKSVLAYRAGFHIELVDVDDSALDGAIGHWLASGRRLDDATVEAAVVRLAAQAGGRHGLPLQFHVGYGDPDVVLHQSNPSLLTAFIEWCKPYGTNVVLLHCWPFEREAGFLATVYPHVWLDVGLSMNYLGAGAPAFIGRALECTPTTKVLYSSDAFGLADLYAAGAGQFRWAIGKVLDGWLADGAATAPDIELVARRIASLNAAAIYPVAS
jgi:uncharacterized protein